MIITEELIINNRNFIHTYSNENRYILRDNVEYYEAYDPKEFNRQYIEGRIIEEEIEQEEE